jgi:formamidopyrimidine-DNA glycosylase
MPELPEVETIARGLAPILADKKIVGLNVLYSGSFVGDKNQVIGQKIIAIDRFAKILRIRLENELYLLFHLKMTGQLIYTDSYQRIAGGHADHDWHAKLPNSHTRIIFALGEDQTLFFNDMRKFGWCKLVTEQEMNTYFAKFGPEPLPKLDIVKLEVRAGRMQKSAIKKFLLDQSVVSGIGNIYADEILFASKIHPRRQIGTITTDEWQQIASHTKDILELAISEGGTTDSDYVNALGKKGGMQDYLQVYHHAGEPCPEGCGDTIERIVVGGRGTHFCPRCQKEFK